MEICVNFGYAGIKDVWKTDVLNFGIGEIKIFQILFKGPKEK